jgi:hypothetical protein
MEATSSYEMFVTTYITAQHHNPEDRNTKFHPLKTSDLNYWNICSWWHLIRSQFRVNRGYVILPKNRILCMIVLASFQFGYFLDLYSSSSSLRFIQDVEKCQLKGSTWIFKWREELTCVSIPIYKDTSLKGLLNMNGTVWIMYSPSRQPALKLTTFHITNINSRIVKGLKVFLLTVQVSVSY